MEQRRLRLGDILDDYCPRERRVTNHAIVAMIEEDIKQTRCTTCDAEHAYKGAKVPRRRKKETPAALYKEVLAALPETEGAAALAVAGSAAVPATVTADDIDDVDAVEDSESFGDTPLVAAAVEHQAMSDESIDMTPDIEPEPMPHVEDGPVHRPLIRAQLPRPEGMKVERPIPDFTIRHTNGRGNGHFRGGGDARAKARPQGGNGGRPPGRFAGAPGRPGGRGAQAAGFRSGPPRHGGRKRSR